MRRVLALLVTAVIGLTGCQGNTTPATGVSASAATVSASQTTAFSKPLGDILTEAGFGKTDFSLSADGQSAIVKVQGTPCRLEVQSWQDNTYKVTKVGDRVLGDQSKALNDLLGGQSPSADVINSAVTAAYKSGQLAC